MKEDGDFYCQAWKKHHKINGMMQMQSNDFILMTMSVFQPKLLYDIRNIVLTSYGHFYGAF